MKQIDLTKVKDRAVKTVYECENKYYITQIKNITQYFNGYGMLNKVTFNGLKEVVYVTEPIYTDYGIEYRKVTKEINLIDGTFCTDFQLSVKVFNEVLMGSIVMFKCRPKIEINGSKEEIKLTYPKNLTVIKEGGGDTLPTKEIIQNK